VTEALLATLDPGPDDVVLELAAGTGDFTAALRPRVSRLIATDLSESMVEAARRRVPDVEHRVLDMQALDLADASVDAIVCRYGYMLVPDRDRAFAETRRVLRPGGRLAFATWAGAKRNPWATVFGPVLVARGHMEAPKPGEPSQFGLGDPDEIEALVRDAGFDEVATDEVAVEFRVTSWEEYVRVQTTIATSLREALAGLDERERAEVDSEARARFERHRTTQGYVLPGAALVTGAR
jgi:ubiquinone/menaquinone biosynthesis C-methylase UbiE